MLHRLKVQLLVLIVSLLLLPFATSESAGAATAGLTPAELTKIEKGEVVVKSETYPTGNGAHGSNVKAYCVINTLPEAAWAVMLDYHKFDQFMPRLDKVEVLEKTDRTMKVTETVHVALGVISYTIDLTFKPEQRTVNWMLDKTRRHDIAETSGSWEFLPYSQGKTLLRYTTTLNSGFFIPRFLEQFLLRNDLSDALSSLKRRAESNGTWKKTQ